MGTDGVLLYVKINSLRDEVGAIEKIKNGLDEYANQCDRCKNNIIASDRVSSCNWEKLQNCCEELQSIISKLNTLKLTLSSVCDDYAESNEKSFSTYDMGNLYAKPPFTKTKTFKVLVGVGVLAVVVTTIIVAPELITAYGAGLAEGLTDIMGVEVSTATLEGLVGAKTARNLVFCVAADSTFSGFISMVEGKGFASGFTDTLADDGILSFITVPFGINAEFLTQIAKSKEIKLFIGMVNCAINGEINEDYYILQSKYYGYSHIDETKKDKEYGYGALGEALNVGELPDESGDFAVNCLKLTDAINQKTEEIYVYPGYKSNTAGGKKIKGSSNDDSLKNNSQTSQNYNYGLPTSAYNYKTIFPLKNGNIGQGFATFEMSEVCQMIEKNKQQEEIKKLEEMKKFSKMLIMD